jgi:fructose-bisphosphate aldolase class II
MKESCLAHNREFGCAGQGSRIRALGLEAMSKRYAAGELAARVQ